jgi:hypothetical protein
MVKVDMVSGSPVGVKAGLQEREPICIVCGSLGRHDLPLPPFEARLLILGGVLFPVICDWCRRPLVIGKGRGRS